MKILITDDEPGLRTVLSNLLEKYNYTPLTAENGRQTIETIKTNKVDLILLDIDLIEETGIDILHRIRRIDQNLPVIMCSGLDDIGSATQSMKMGAVDYIRKPFDNEEVIEKIEKVLQKTKPALRAKPILILISCIILSGLAVFLIKFGFYKKEKWTIYEIPYDNPTSLTRSKMSGSEYLWVSDWTEQNIYKHNLDHSFSIPEVYHFTENYPGGLATNGLRIWSSDASADKIYEHRLDKNLSVVRTSKSPGSNPTGLCWDGTTIWSCDADTRKFYKHKLDNKLSVIAFYDSPGSCPVGLFWDGKNIWSADADTNEIYKHNMDSNLSVTAVYEPEPVRIRSKISGLTWDGEHIWLALEGVNKIYRYNLFLPK